MTGRPAWRQPSRWLGWPVLLLALLLAFLLAGCEADGESGAPKGPGAEVDLDRLTGCGPLKGADVRGKRPSYAGKVLDRFPNDHAMCAGLWLPGAEQWLVPQGMTVAGDTAYVSGFDGTARVGYRFCSVERVDLRTGRLLSRVAVVKGQVGDRPVVECRHGGGLLIDEHGLWLIETKRMWLLDPESMAVLRGWAIAPPVRGSFALWGPRGRMGLGTFEANRRARVTWYDVDDLLTPELVTVDEQLAVGSIEAPRNAQGAVYAALDGAEPGVWFARSDTRCGILVGPEGQRRSFVPGAEAMSLDERGRLWVVSESGSRLYQELDRPLTPMLARFDTSDLRRWHRPTCSV